MLAEARWQLPPANALPGGIVAEQKPDGFRAIVFARRDLVMVQSRQGADLSRAFPDIARAARALGDSLVLDGELVVPVRGGWTSPHSRAEPVAEVAAPRRPL
ncbi:ATP-dependent DNA ligase [Streptomyces eurythermus]